MASGVLADALRRTLSSDEATRRAAEGDLGAAARAPGACAALLALAAGAACGEPAVRVAAAVYLKNAVLRRYDADADALPEGEKAALRDALVPAAVAAGAGPVRPQLLAALGRVVRADYPGAWPGALAAVGGALDAAAHALAKGPDAGTCDGAAGALGALVALVAWQGGRAGTHEVRDATHGRVFPPVLGMLSSGALLDAALGEAQPGALAVVHLACKAVLRATQHNLATALFCGPSAGAWVSALARVASAPVPPSVRSLSAEDAETSAWWMAKKWALRVLARLFLRYGSTRLESYAGRGPAEEAFAATHAAHVSAPALGVFLGVAEDAAAAPGASVPALAVPGAVLAVLCDYLGAAAADGRTWRLLQGALPLVLERLVFPRLCFSSADAEMWADAPEEYVRQRLDPFDDARTPDGCAAGLLADIVRRRRKAVLAPLVGAATAILSSPSAGGDDDARRRDGALRLLGALAPHIGRDKALSAEREGLVLHAVLPSASHAAAFVRMRALWALSQFDALAYGPAGGAAAVDAAMAGLSAGPLPVRVAGALALSTLLEADAPRDALAAAGRVLPAVEALLRLANDVQLDSVAYVIETVVRAYAGDLAPVAVALCVQLRDTLGRHLEGYRNVLGDGAEQGDDWEPSGADTERLMAVAGLLETLCTLVASMADAAATGDVLSGIEEAIAPLVASVLARGLTDVYDEALSLIDALTHARKAVGPGVWALVPYVCAAFSSDGHVFAEAVATTLDNVVSFGADALFSPAGSEALYAIVGVIRGLFAEPADSNTEADYDIDERVAGCRLMEALMLHAPAGADALRGLIPAFVRAVLPAIAGSILPGPEHDDAPSLAAGLAHLGVVLNALRVDAPGTLAALGPDGAAPFLTALLRWAPRVGRVHERRLLVAGLAALLRHVAAGGALPGGVQPGDVVAALVPPVVAALAGLPAAVAERERLVREAEDDSDYAGDSDYDAEDSDAEDAPSGQSAPAQQGTYVDNDDDDEDDYDYEYREDALEEDVYFTSPLDAYDAGADAAHALRALAAAAPDGLRAVVAGLPADLAAVAAALVSPGAQR